MTTSSDDNPKQYELVLEGAEDSSAETLERLTGALVSECALTANQAQSALQSFPFTLMQADSEIELQPYMEALKQAGGKALILRTSKHGGGVLGASFEEEHTDNFNDTLQSESVEHLDEAPEALEFDWGIEAMELGDKSSDESNPQDTNPAPAAPDSTVQTADFGDELSLNFEEAPKEAPSDSPPEQVDAYLPSEDTSELGEVIQETFSDELSFGEEKALVSGALGTDEQTSTASESTVSFEPEVDIDLTAEDVGDELDFSSTQTEKPSATKPVQSPSLSFDDGNEVPAEEELGPVAAPPDSPPVASKPNASLPDLATSGLGFDEPEESVPLQAKPTQKPEEKPRTVSPDLNSSGLSLDGEEESSKSAPKQPSAKEVVSELSTDDDGDEILMADDEPGESAEKQETQAQAPDRSPLNERASNKEQDTPTSPRKLSDIQKRKIDGELLDDLPDSELQTEVYVVAGDFADVEEDETTPNSKGKKKGLRKHLDLVLYIVLGLAVVYGANFFFVAEQEPLFTEQQISLMRKKAEKMKADRAAQEKQAAQAAAEAAANPEPPLPEGLPDAAEISGTFKGTDQSLEWSLQIVDGLVDKGSFTFSTPEPAEPTPEQVVNGDYFWAWIDEAKVELIPFSLTMDGTFESRTPAKVYVIYHGGRDRLIADTLVTLAWDKASRTLSGEVKIWRGFSEKPEGSELILENSGTAETPEFKLLLSGRIEHTFEDGEPSAAEPQSNSGASDQGEGTGDGGGVK